MAKDKDPLEPDKGKHKKAKPLHPKNPPKPVDWLKLLERNIEKFGESIGGAVMSEHTNGCALVLIKRTTHDTEYTCIHGLCGLSDREAKGLVALAAAEGMTRDEAEREDLESME